MIGDEKIVNFEEYCAKCKHNGTVEYEEPCNSCLTATTNTDSHKPINFEEEEK